jgi:hypothetical protein
MVIFFGKYFNKPVKIKREPPPPKFKIAISQKKKIPTDLP